MREIGFDEIAKAAQECVKACGRLTPSCRAALENSIAKESSPAAKFALATLCENAELAERRKAEEARGAKAFTPPHRQRMVSKALQAYGRMVSSADKGGVRVIDN